jgi:PilZ domain
MTHDKPATLVTNSPFLKRWGQLVLEKRHEHRYSTNDPAEVKVLPSDGVVLTAKIVDVSRSGVGIEIERPLLKSTRVEIGSPRHKLVIFGEVRYCKPAGARFHIGVLIEGVASPDEGIVNEGGVDNHGGDEPPATKDCEVNVRKSQE